MAQDQYKPKYLRDNDKELNAIAKQLTPEGWIELKENANVKRTEFFSRFGIKLGMDKDYEMKRIRDVLDRNGNRHEIYQLYYKGIMVEGVQFGLHSKKELLYLTHGKMVENLQHEPNKAMKESDAFDATIKHLKHAPAKYANEKPQGELIIAMQNIEDFTKKKFSFSLQISIGCW